MANIFALGGIGAAVVAGAVSHLLGGGAPATVPGWVGLPGEGQLTVLAATAAAGQVDVRFNGASDTAMAELQARLKRGGFGVNDLAAGASPVAHDFDARLVKQGLTVRVIQLPDHDEWRVTYWDSAAG